MPFNEGENVGPYRVMEKLGQGGMATVYKAYHASLDRYVALKVLHPAFLEDENFLARFQREARLVAKLEHPNIVPIYDFAEHDGQPYLVMKFVEGETLKAHLNRGRLSVDEIWGVVNAVGAGLAYAHKQGILHRDIKPSNVIVATDGQMYLADFGLARIAEMGESTLSGDMIMGTPQYISPEQAMGVKDLDAGTDIYSFAVMLYEMVVGQVPFSSDTPFSIIHDHIYSPLPLPKTINPAVPDEVERVLLKALAKERKDRYAEIPALVKAFKKAWDDANVDMAEVTMTAPIRSVMPTAPVTPPATAPAIATPPEEAATVAKTDAATVVQADEPSAPAEKTKITDKPEKKKRAIWPFAAAGVLLLVACFFIISTLGQDGLFRDLAEADAQQFEEPNPNENIPSPTRIAPIPPENESPEVMDARNYLKENPDDPYAHLDLALAILDTSLGQNPLVYQQLKEAGDLAGDDIQFFEDAGFELMDRGIWTGSAAMFLRAVKITQFHGDPNEDLIYFMHETSYKAASQPEMPNYLPFDEIGKVDEPLSLVVEARHTYYHGNPDDALALLNEVKRMKPGFHEARLLEGEMLARARKADEARRIFETILADLDTPEWIRVEADEALRNLP